MASLHHLGDLLAALYTVIACFILWSASRPSCRICVHRGYCPNRVGRFVVPECAKGKPARNRVTFHFFNF
jgi:hypothetical protein